MKIKTRKKQHGRLSKTLILLLLLVTAFFVLPNVLIAPRLREKLEKKMNRAGSLQGSMGSLTINLFTQRISFGNVSVNYLEKAYSASAKVPSIKVRSRTLPLLRGEIVPRSIVITKPVIVVEEPGVPLPRGVTHTGRLRMLQAGMGDGLLRVLIESQTKTRRRKVLQDVIIEKVLLKEGTIRYRNQSNSSSPFEMELQRVSALLDDVLLDDKAELRSATLRSLTGFWPASTEPGLQYAGSFERSGDTYQGHLVGRISAFPLVLVREPIEKELGTVIRGGLVDLDSDVKVHGTLMDSTHTLVINGLDLSMEKSLHRKIKVDLANLVVEILKMLGSEDNIVLENIRLKADLAANTENLWEDLARSALEAVLSRLAERMLHGIREGGEKARERLKQIGESLLDALE